MTDLTQKGDAVPQPLATVANLSSQSFAGLSGENAVPADWVDRAKKAWTLYETHHLVKPCINAWRTFAVGDEITVTASDEALKTATQDLAKRLRLSRFVKDMILQLLVKGDAVGFKTRSANGDLSELVCVNPVSVRVKYRDGQLIEAVQVAEGGFGGEETPLALDQVIHLKWDAPPFAARGNAMVLPAFEPIALLDDYHQAEKAIARRWTTPLRMIKVGGSYGQKMVMPDQTMLEQVRDAVDDLDLKSGLVVPFYVTCETHGIDGQVPDTVAKINQTKEDVLVAMGLSRAVIAADGPNFSTASIGLQKMLVMIREIKGFAVEMLDWVLDDWKASQGFTDESHHYLFNDLDPTDGDGFRKIMLELYDRGLISRQTLQAKLELKPDVEREQIKQERQENPLDERLTKPLVDLVLAGLLTADQAKEMMGLQSFQGPTTTADQCGPQGMRTQAGLLCDDCGHFDDGRNICRIHKTETHFDSSACRFLTERPTADDDA